MSKLEIINNEEGQPEKGYIRGATLCYIKLQEGSFKYGSKTEKEYCVDVVVDKATQKAWKKMFAKNTPKEIDTPEFEGKYKIAPVHPDEDEQFIVKLKAKAQVTKDLQVKDFNTQEEITLAKGDPIPYEWNTRPKLFVKGDEGVKDVTMSVLAANGSVGDVSFKITTNDFGTFPQLTGILVTDLIEYESSGGSGNASPFGEIEGGLNAGNGTTQQKASAGQPDEEEEGTPSPTETNSEGSEEAPFDF